MFSQVAVLEALEVQDAVQADGVDGLTGVGDHARLRVEGDAEARFAEHRQVVGAVAHGDGLGEVHPFSLGDELQEVRLPAAIHDFAQVTAGERAVLADFEFVGIDIVDAEPLAQVFPEESETAAEDGDLVTVGLEIFIVF